MHILNEPHGDMIPIIPLYPQDKKDILNIDRNTKEDLRLKHHLIVDRDWESNTIATTTIDIMIQVLHKTIVNNGLTIFDVDGSGMIEFYDLLTIATSNKVNESAEKTGNINVKFFPGERVKDIISDDTPREEKKYRYEAIDAAYSYLEDEGMNRAMLKIDKLARKNLLENRNILLPKDFMAIAVTYVFLENVYRELMQKLVLTGKPIVTINFNDIIEFHATRKPDGAVINLRPGMGSKLDIKSDETTEKND